jgi:glycine cleavage system aminomethyltransferase T
MAVRNGVGLFDMTSFGKIRVEGRIGKDQREQKTREVRRPRRAGGGFVSVFVEPRGDIRRLAYPIAHRISPRAQAVRR